MTTTAEHPRVLCVDDEPALLEGLERHLRRRFEVHTCTSGLHGLECIATHGPFAVVISDMRMPQMSGATFLSRVREMAPDTVRILLTGQADLDSAIVAVNNGQIFRFLTKPCPAYQLQQHIDAGVKHYNMIHVERTLLEKTLRGAVKALTDVLALTSPLAFGRATRVGKRVSSLCDELGIHDRWHIEIAAMTSELGAIALPEEIANKLYAGKPLEPQEQTAVDGMGRVGRNLLADIPRMEPVLAVLEACEKAEHAGPDATCTDTGARLILLAREFDALERSGVAQPAAIAQLSSVRDRYDERTLQALARTSQMGETLELHLCDVREGMIFADDVWTEHGTLLVARGYEVTQGFLARARAYRHGYVREPVRVIRKKPE